MTQNTETDETDEPLPNDAELLDYDGTHVVTALEPVWAEAKYQPDPDGLMEPLDEPIVVGNFIDHLADEVEYDCSCGYETSHWYDIEDHFEAVLDARGEA